jgi:hypothetical protein
MLPKAIVGALDRRILLARLDCRRRSPRHLALGLVRIKKGAAIRGMLVDGTFAVEEPVTVTQMVAGRNQSGIGLIHQGPQVLLRPGQEISFVAAESRQVGGIEGTRHVTAVNRAEWTSALSAAKAVNLADQW